MTNHPGRPRAGLLAVTRNDQVTPPSVYWQVTPRPRRETPGPVLGVVALGRGRVYCPQWYTILTLALPLPCGGASFLASHQPVVDPHPLLFLAPTPGRAKGEMGAGAVSEYPLGNVGQNVPGCPN